MAIVKNRNLKDHDLKLFELFIQKQNTLYENMKMWHNILLAINSVVFGAFALIIGLGKVEKQPFDILNFFEYYKLFVISIALLGIVSSITWLLAQIDSIRWQDRMNKVLRKLESKIMEFPQDGMWHMIVGISRPSKVLDIMSTNMLIPVSLILFWSVICGAGFYPQLLTLVGI